MKRSLYKEKTVSFSVKLEIEEPVLYRVMLLKDDFTPRELILGMLERFFNLARRDAAEVMLMAQQQGSALCGLFTKDIAATKVSAVEEYAVSHEVPLVCSMEAA